MLLKSAYTLSKLDTVAWNKKPINTAKVNNTGEVSNVNHQTQLGFISVLFILVTFFALQAMAPREVSIEVGKKSDLEGHCHCLCDEHFVQIVGNGMLKYRHKVMRMEDILVTIRDSGCQIGIVVRAAEFIELQESLRITNQLIAAFPNQRVRWGSAF